MLLLWGSRRSAVTLSVLAILLAACASSPVDKRPSPEVEFDAMRARAIILARELPGYQRLRDQFEIEDGYATAEAGAHNVLFLRLRMTTDGGLNAAWWSNPLPHGVPQYTWLDFLSCFARVNDLVGKHPWLSAWFHAGPGRLLELHACGCALEPCDDTPVYSDRCLWSQAGLSGEPTYEILARRGDEEWAKLYLSPSEDKILVVGTWKPDPHGPHWLDQLDVSFPALCDANPNATRYVTVLPDGTHTSQRCSGDEP